jgi:ABC-type multidrug transport system fused ATPase/permease subunit
MATEPWLIDGTLKENILMNRPFNESKFTEALKLSFLERDLDSLDSGIQTKFSDTNMSIDPLFKLKIECARAIYAE